MYTKLPKLLNKKLGVIIVSIIMVSTMAIALHSNNPATASAGNKSSYIANSGNISLTGNVRNNFNGDLIASNNVPSLWGPNNAIKNMYIAYNSSDLFIGLDENISGNSLMVFINNVTDSVYGTTNMNTLNTDTYSRDISFTTPLNYFSGIYFSGVNKNATAVSYALSTKVGNTSSVATPINSTFIFSSVNNTTEMAIPWSGMFPDGFHGELNFGISTFVIGSSGPWVGTGMPYNQKGIYDNGIQSSFIINNTIPIHIKNINVKPTQSYKNYPSYLLLNNFVNNSIYISTGIHDSFLGSNFGYKGFSIQNIDANNTLLPAKLELSSGSSTTASRLTSNNMVQVNTTKSITYIADVPHSNEIAAIQKSNTSLNDSMHISGAFSYKNTNNTLYINTSPGIGIHLINAKYTINKSSKSMSINISSNPGLSAIVVSINSTSSMNISKIINLNNQNIFKWLSKSVNTETNRDLTNEYNTSLLLVKDDQNPMTGEIVASPSPVYFYNWVRDASFSAISLEMSGHVNSALKYWKFMAGVQGVGTYNGTWQTRFNFWNGKVAGFVYPEFDSLGLFEIGIYDLYQATHNASMLNEFRPNIISDLKFQETSIKNHGLIQEDHSIWEMQYGYWFWTQSMNYIGMKDMSRIMPQLVSPPSTPNHSVPPASSVLNLISTSSRELKQNIIKYFYADGIFAQHITPITNQYGKNNYTTYLMNNTPDSSQILPIAMGFINPSSPVAKSTVNNLYFELWNYRVGGLPRYYNDLYHYTEYGGYHQSSGPSPPWIITTLFLGLYDERTGNMSGALSLLKWSYNHTQSGLLPEAIDPNFGTVIASTSPLTWSSAMYIIVALNYRSHSMPPGTPLL